MTMSVIDIQHPHQLPAEQARQAVQVIAQKLTDRFEVEHHWQGETLHFERTGVEGSISLTEQHVHVRAELGFLAAMFKEPIESEIRRVLQEKFGAA
jgi:putative polyhydroxyalkanoate system protein